MDISNPTPYINRPSSLEQNIDPNKTKNLAELKKACEGFEAIFINQLLKQMRASMSEETLFGPKSHALKTVEGMYDEELSATMAKGRGMGIAHSLFEQLKASIR